VLPTEHLPKVSTRITAAMRRREPLERDVAHVSCSFLSFPRPRCVRSRPLEADVGPVGCPATARRGAAGGILRPARPTVPLPPPGLHNAIARGAIARGA